MRELNFQQLSISLSQDLAPQRSGTSKPKSSPTRHKSGFWNYLKSGFRRPSTSSSCDMSAELPPTYPEPPKVARMNPLDPITCIDQLKPIALQPDHIRFRNQSTRSARRPSNSRSLKNLAADARYEIMGRSYGNLFFRARKNSALPNRLSAEPSEEHYQSCPTGLDRRPPLDDNIKALNDYRKRAQSVDASLYNYLSKKNHQVVETSTIYFMNESQSFFTPWGLEQSQGKVNQYHLIREIGAGAFGKVMLCKSEESERYYACKIISKNRLKKQFRWSNADHLHTIKREIAILKKISKHPNINALVEVLDDGSEDNLYMSTFPYVSINLLIS
jgi:hypothetical protein